MIEGVAVIKQDKISVQKQLLQLNRKPEHRQRLGWFGPRIGMLLIVAFVVVLLPLYAFMWVFNKVYFWVRNQQPVDPKPFFNFDRHRIPHITFMDKLWCEYCEWANGTLQWGLAIANEIERRYCPIKNACDPHCEKAKGWRASFLNHDHAPEELVHYYNERYPKESGQAEAA